MKYKVQVEGKFFEVEIEDLDTRPVRVRVEDEWLEVWPEGEAGLSQEHEASHQPVKTTPALSGSSVTRGNGNSKLLRAPIPGTIVNILVKAGMDVATGQELLVLEAMKMKNTIRSPRDGKISTILVAIGQSVKYQDVLVEYAE